MSSDSSDAATIDDQIAYHSEMECAATRAGDFTQAAHHRKMQEILDAMKQMQPHKTAEQITDEDHKVPATSADREQLE